METMKSVLISFLFVVAAQTLAASEVKVKGMCQTPGFSYYQYDFSIQYKNDQLVPGDRVELVKGYSGHGSVNQEEYQEQISWYDLGEISPRSSADNVSKFPIRMYYMATGGYLSTLDFAFRITHADNSVTWDNGTVGSTGHQEHYYQGTFFVLNQVECFDLQSPTDLPVQIH